MPKFYSPPFRERIGQSVIVVRELDETECELLKSSMFVVEFEDGVQLDVFQDEIIDENEAEEA